jgi:predicted small lipoprotein YifL
MKRVSQILLVGLSVLALSACGLRGDLERPEPLWGNPTDHSQSDESESEDS